MATAANKDFPIMAINIRAVFLHKKWIDASIYSITRKDMEIEEDMVWVEHYDIRLKTVDEKRRITKERCY